MHRQAVHFGAGSIGRGFLGQIYYESGYHTTFIDVIPQVVDALNQRGGYPIDLVSEDGTNRISVENVSAISGRDVDAASSALARAEIASTAVGMHVLPHIAPVIAAAIPKRFSEAAALPLDIILCENLHDGEAHMRALVRECLVAEWHDCLDSRVGFVEASIGRMVPVMTGEQQERDILAVCVEPYCELPVDAGAFRGAVPPLKYLKPSPHFAAYVERKLFVHNLTHAAVAYLGYRKGYAYIYEAIRDAGVLACVEGAGRESCAALSKKYGINLDELEEHRMDLVRRYHNSALADQIERVARDPIRKLGRDDRLIGALSLCLEQGIQPEYIAEVTAAALLYDNPNDPASTQLQEQVRVDGVDAVLRGICRLEPDSAACVLIKSAFDRMKHP